MLAAAKFPNELAVVDGADGYISETLTAIARLLSRIHFSRQKSAADKIGQVRRKEPSDAAAAHRTGESSDPEIA